MIRQSTEFSESNDDDPVRFERRDNQGVSSITPGVLLASVWRRKWFFLAVFVPCLVAGGAYLAIAPPIYDSTAELLVEREGVPLDQTDRYSRPDIEFLNSQARVLSSPAIISQALDGVELPPPEDPEQDHLAMVLDSLSVTPIKDTNVLQVSVSRPDGEEAQRILQAIVASYDAFLQQDDRDAYRDSLNVLTQSERQLRQELQALKDEHVTLREGSPLMGQGSDPAGVQKTLLTQLGQSVISAKARRIELENQLEACRQTSPSLAVAFVHTGNQGGNAVNIQAALLTNLGQSYAEIKSRRLELENQIETCRQMQPDVAIEFGHASLSAHNSPGIRQSLLTTLGESMIEVKNKRMQLENLITACQEATPSVAADLGLSTQSANGTSTQTALLANLGATMVSAKSRRIELENQLKAFRGAGSDKDSPITRPTLEALRQSGEPSTTRLLLDSSSAALGMKSTDDGSLDALVDAGELARIREALFAARDQERLLVQKFGTKHPDMIAVREQIANWESQLSMSTQAAYGNLRNEYDATIEHLAKEYEAGQQQEVELTALFQSESEEAKNSVLEYLKKELQSLQHQESRLEELFEKDALEAKNAVLEHLEKSLQSAQEQEKKLGELYEAESEKGKGAILTHLDAELASAQRQESQLAKLYEGEFQKAKNVDGFVVKEQHLLDDITRLQTMHDSLLVQAKHWELSEQAAADGRAEIKVTVLQPASLPAGPAWPIRWLVLAVCGILGSLGGAGVVTLVERVGSKKMRSVGDVRRQVQSPVVGEIPRLPAAYSSQAKAISRGRLVHETPESRIAEAFRGLRTRLSNGAGLGPGLVVQLASPAEDEGKTTVAANLAFSFAQLGKRVAVIDADMRRGALHEVFEVSNAAGLSSVLRGETILEEALTKSSLANIDVLPRGPEVLNGADLLGQPKFASILAELRGKYDLVLVDTPALLELTEALVVAPKSDHVILSVVIDKTTAADARRADDLLDSVGATVSGVVVNGVRTRKSSYYDRRTNGCSNGNGSRRRAAQFN